MRDIAVALIVFGLLPWVLVRPHIGVLLWSWLGYMNPHRLGWGFAYDFPFAQVVAIVTLASVALTREPKRFPLTPLVGVWLLFIAWMGLTTVFALEPDSAAEQIEKVIKIQVVVFITLMVMGSRERLNQLLWVAALSIGFFGIKGGVFTIISGGAHRVWGPDGTFIAGNNELALALLMVLPLFYYLRSQSTNRWVRLGLLVSMVLIGFSVVGSYSRGAFLAGFSMLFMLWLKSRSKMITGIAFTFVVTILIVFMPQNWSERMSTIENYQEDQSAVGRINAWWTAVYIASDRPFGGGFECLISPKTQGYSPNITTSGSLEVRRVDAHSIYFEVLAEHGFIGLGLFLLMGSMALLMARWIIRAAHGHEELKWAGDLARMLQVSLVAYATGGAFLGLAYFDLYYHILAILVLTRQQVQQVLASKTAVQSGRQRRLAHLNAVTNRTLVKR